MCAESVISEDEEEWEEDGETSRSDVVSSTSYSWLHADSETTFQKQIYLTPTPEHTGSTVHFESRNDDGSTQRDHDTREFKLLDDLASVVCGTVLKFAIARCTGQSPAQVLEENEVVRNLLPSSHHFDTSIEDLEKLELLCTEESDNKPPQYLMKRQVTEHRVKVEDLKRNSDDEDSLLDSEQDYDKERDDFFRKYSGKKFFLITKKGVDEFTNFLKGTVGEKNWNLWLDIDRAKLLTGEDDEHR